MFVANYARKPSAALTGQIGFVISPDKRNQPGLAALNGKSRLTCRTHRTINPVRLEANIFRESILIKDGT
tara:strand:- start:327 stop:536 length:210 start_codon:yes stop_codon:yes gene_type:complete